MRFNISVQCCLSVRLRNSESAVFIGDRLQENVKFRQESSKLTLNCTTCSHITQTSWRHLEDVSFLVNKFTKTPYTIKTKARYDAEDEDIHHIVHICWKYARPQTIPDVEEFVSSSDLEKCINSIAQQCSEWVPSEWESDKNITIIHTTPVHQLMSWEDKSWNKSSIFLSITDSYCS